MQYKLTDAEFAGKVDSEGGIFAALEYGLRGENLAEQDTGFAHTWLSIEQRYLAMQTDIHLLESMLDQALEEYEEEDWEEE